MGKKKAYTNQHIVPVSYLKRFAQKGKSAYRIGVEQFGRKPYIASINHVGYIENYYDIPFLDDVKYWEHYFDNEIESPCRIPMTNLIAKTMLSASEMNVISDIDKYILSKFIIIQLLRVPSFIDYHILELERKIEAYKLKIIENYLLFTQRHADIMSDISFSKDEIKNLILNLITNPEKLNQYCKILANKPWVAYVNCTALPFITSDNPVVMTNIQNLSTSRSVNGIGNENTFFSFPSHHI